MSFLSVSVIGIVALLLDQCSIFNDQGNSPKVQLKQKGNAIRSFFGSEYDQSFSVTSRRVVITKEAIRVKSEVCSPVTTTYYYVVVLRTPCSAWCICLLLLVVVY